MVAPESPLGRQAQLRRRVPIRNRVPRIPSVRHVSACGSHTSWLTWLSVGSQPFMAPRLPFSGQRGDALEGAGTPGLSACVHVCAPVWVCVGCSWLAPPCTQPHPPVPSALALLQHRGHLPVPAGRADEPPGAGARGHWSRHRGEWPTWALICVLPQRSWGPGAHRGSGLASAWGLAGLARARAPLPGSSGASHSPVCLHLDASCPVRPRDVVARWVDPVAVAELMLCGAGWVMGDVGMMGQDALSLESRAPWASGTTLTRTLRVALFRPLPVGTPWEVLSGPSRSHKSCGHRLHCCAGPTSGGRPPGDTQPWQDTGLCAAWGAGRRCQGKSGGGGGGQAQVN